MKNFILLVVVVAGFSFGLYFYCRGFLLTRHTLGKNNICTDGAAGQESICVIKPRFRRAIWIVIDALRFDFVAPISSDQNEYYHNKLTIVHELLSRRPRNSILYKFIADAPTTTLQRLKGLTTGSLPTFVDAGSNFGGTEIDEDNLIDQLARRGKNLTFLGDDTWMTLFPSQFSRKFPFPSFDVKDLHTVDNGILEHLFDELRGKYGRWDVLVAHFLGVDHCGHKYGPNHPEMAAKLEQMDKVLREIIDSMDSETVLFVLGDHGMTESGNHGGDSGDEINSALFVYNPAELHREETNIRDGVSQIDFVPTMALLLDIPIPFSNLGKVLIELFPDQMSRSRAVQLNVVQVFRFSDMYTTNFHDPLLIDNLQPLFKTYYAHEPSELTTEKYLEYIGRISRIFVECWAKFHVGWMALGIVTLFETFLWLLSYLIDRTNSVRGRRLLLKATSFVLSFWVVVTRQETLPPIVGIFFGLPIIFHINTIVISFWQRESVSDSGGNSVTSVFGGLLLIIHGLSQFSNSFVVQENISSHYFATALFAALFLRTTKSAKRSVDKKKKQASMLSKIFESLDAKFGWASIIYGISAVMLLRLTMAFGRCREEQAPCVSSSFTLPFASLLDENTKAVRISVGISCLFFIYWLPRKFLVYNGHLTVDTILGVILDFGHTLLTLLIAVYWIMQWIPEQSLAAISANANLVPPLVFYGVFVSIIFIFLVDPILTTVHLIREGSEQGKRKAPPPLPAPVGGDSLSEAETVRRAYQHLKMNWRYYLSQMRMVNHANGEKRWAAFGLASGYSGPLVAVWTSWMLLFVLILGDGFTFPALSFMLVAVAVLELDSRNGRSDVIIFVAILCELSSHFFYAFGNQPTFATIPWEAAFIGIPGNFRFHWVQVALVILRISAAQVLVVFLIPLKACWRCYRRKLGILSAVDTGPNLPAEAGALGTEADLIRPKDGFVSDVVYLNCAFLAAAAVKVLCSTLASAVHRRHLMVWKVFAPKFIFDGVQFLVICGVVLVQYLFVARLHNSLLRRFSSAEFVSHNKLK